MSFTREWLNKLSYNYIMEYHSAIKENESLMQATARMDLKGIMLIKKRLQSQKVIHWMVQFIWHYWNDKNVEMENRVVGATG